jgi:hypothetical protein
LQTTSALKGLNGHASLNPMFSRVNVWICYGLTLATLQGCGGCEDDPTPGLSTSMDARVDEGIDLLDGDLPPPPVNVPDANIPPGDPPEELAGES